MENTLVIKPATLADIETLLQFEQGVITAERPFTNTIRPEKVNYYDLQTLIESDNSYLIIGYLDDVAVASGYIRIEKSKPQHHPDHYGYLGFMYVNGLHRGKGLNKQILEHLKSWAKDRGISKLKLDVYATNESAINAYQKFGFESHMVEMMMDI